MLPLAQAAAAAGHTVAVAVAAELCPRVESAGLTAAAAGDPFPSWFAELQRRHPAEPWNRLAPDRILQWFVPRLFGEIGAPRMLDDLTRVSAGFAPDVIVHETYELAGAVCAAAIGVPAVGHTVGPLPTADVLRLAAASVAPLRHERGLDSVATAGDDDVLVVDVCPPSLQRDGAHDGAPRVHVRPAAAQAGPGETLPDAVLRLPERPLVHATLGTAATSADQTVLATVIAALRDAEYSVVVTVGPDHDPGAFGPQPDHVVVARYIPYSLLLPLCDVVVSHGGAGTSLAALGCGLPLLAIPQGADQYVVAEACARRGVGRTLLMADLAPQTVATEIGRLLSDPAYGLAAAAVRDEMRAMASPEDAVSLLERL